MPTLWGIELEIVIVTLLSFKTIESLQIILLVKYFLLVVPSMKSRDSCDEIFFVLSLLNNDLCLLCVHLFYLCFFCVFFSFHCHIVTEIFLIIIALKF